jgi:hypothetical protein
MNAKNAAVGQVHAIHEMMSVPSMGLSYVRPRAKPLAM